MKCPLVIAGIVEGLREFGRRFERFVRKRLAPSIRHVTRKTGVRKPPVTPPATGRVSDRGTIIVVSHDAHVGGAQQVARILARWLLESTGYDVKFVLMRGGGLIKSYEQIAPVFEMPRSGTANVEQELRDFAGPNVRAVIINSVASGGFLRVWKEATPIIAFVHEMTKVMKIFDEEVRLIIDRASTIIAGSDAVATVLREAYGCTDRPIPVVHGFVEHDAGAQCRHGSSQAAKRAIGVDPNCLLVTACGMAHWRKGPGIFVEVAHRVLTRSTVAMKFIWVGDGEDRQECERQAERLGIADRVVFAGYQADVHPFLEASDIFLLPSEEDPFPLVCLYAGLHLNPVVCFADAGGIPELLQCGGGRVVRFGDATAMADAVLEYVTDPGSRHRDAVRLRDAVLERHTIATAGPAMLHWIREAARLRPQVSIVVPNFNHARFLDERLVSLDRQTFQDFEVILLDDHSSDDSLSVLRGWARRRPGTRVVAAEQNSGSPFAQWLKGLQLARGDLVWIAESDDTCDPELLARLVPTFRDPSVLLSYVKSTPIDAHGSVLGDYEPLYLDRIHRGRWSSSYVATDHEEVNAALGIANSIPNASSVVFRRFMPEPAFADQLTTMRLCGDWLFYLRAIRGGCVAYVAEPLNSHRRHDATVTQSIEGTPRYFSESSMVRDYVAATYSLSEAALEKIASFHQEDDRRFGRAAVPRSPAAPPAKRRLPAVLFVTSDLSPGGGQLFIIRLANAWAARGGRAFIFNTSTFPDHPQVLAKIGDRIPVFSGPPAEIDRLVSRFGVEVVHSAIWWADACVLGAAEANDSFAWVVTMHGCHETLLEHPDVDPRFPEKIAAMIDRTDAWVHTADKNERVFATYGRPAHDVRIVNGVEREPGPGVSRRQLGLEPRSLLVCLASRAIPEKGWGHAVDAVTRLRGAGNNVELLLIGEGPAAEEVRRQGPAGVHVIPQVANLQDYLSLADVVLLPSFFVGESLPLVLLEALAVGTPVIATAIGDIPEIIGTGDAAAGVLLPLVDGQPDVDALAAAIGGFMDDTVRQTTGERAVARFESRYRMASMVDKYASLYERCLAHRARGRSTVPQKTTRPSVTRYAAA